MSGRACSQPVATTTRKNWSASSADVADQRFNRILLECWSMVRASASTLVLDLWPPSLKKLPTSCWYRDRWCEGAVASCMMIMILTLPCMNIWMNLMCIFGTQPPFCLLEIFFTYSCLWWNVCKFQSWKNLGPLKYQIHLDTFGVELK